MDTREGSAEFVRDVREKLVLEFQLLFAADLERKQKRLALDGVPDGTIQFAVAEITFYQIVLHALMQRFDGQPFIILARQDHDRNLRSLGENFAKGFRSLAVGKIQVEQHYGGCFQL